jgi:hypothetical protein
MTPIELGQVFKLLDKVYHLSHHLNLERSTGRTFGSRMDSRADPKKIKQVIAVDRHAGRQNEAEDSTSFSLSPIPFSISPTDLRD